MANKEDEEDIDLTQETAEDSGKSIQQEAEERRAEAEAKKSKLERGYKFLKKHLKDTKFGKATSKVFGEISKAISKLIAEILPIALILIMAIGLISFILNAPAMMRGKVADILSKVGETADHILFGDNGKFTPTELSLEKRIEILNYISSDLGIDIIGFGFVPTATYKDDGATQEIVSYESELNKVEGYQEGVDIPAWIGFSPATLIIGGLDVLFETIEYEGQQNKVIKEQADADLIYYYLIASERAFIRNEDGVIDTIFKGLDNWSGMLDISGDEGLDGVEVEVNRENETLEISANNGLFTEDNYVFPLDDWTGKYGMPLEFSLALHLSTMSSGLVKEMITNEDLQSEVDIGLNTVTCDAEFKINLKDKDGNIQELDLPYEPADGKKETLYNKIVNGETIEDADLSIKGLLHAITETEYEYTINGTGSYNDMGVARHIKTIEAILSDNQIAVDLDFYEDKTNGTVYEVTYNSYFPIYAPKVDPENLGIDLSGGSTEGEYSISTGAYLCSYNEDGTPNKNTGKLAEEVSYRNDQDEISWYKYYFKENGTTDSAYKYKLMVEEIDTQAGTSKNMTDVSPYVNYPREIYIPNNESETVLNANGEVIAVKIDGLKSISTIPTGEALKGYEAIFKEIDWFFAYNIQENGWDDSLLHYNVTNISIFDSGDITKYPDFNGIAYYSKKFDEIVKNSHISETVRIEAIKGLLEELEDDYKTITTNPNFCESTAKKAEEVEKFLTEKGLTAELIEQIAQMLLVNDDLQVKDLVYVQPYIKKVIKHWYKDIDFSNSNAYDGTTESFEIPYTPETAYENIDIQVVLTPTKGEVYEQKNEPYVIKGDIVLCDGEQEGTVSEIYGENSTVKDASGKDYTWGDGYRATKKIFTQGYYYTYDGSHSTARSIYYQQEIEEASDTLYKVNVVNGAINYAYNLEKAKSAEVQVGETITTYDEIIIEGKGINEDLLTSKGGEKLDTPDGVQVYFVHSGYTGENDENYVEEYLVYIEKESMKYKSPTTTTYENVVSQVERINAVWDSMQIVSKRKQVSFDNTTADGESMAKTGLSILKNCGTKDSEHIYRDLKEMLIELGYYTQAEFDQLNIDVLEWFIPAYHPDKWPQNTLEDLDSYTSAILYPYEEPEEVDEESTEGTSEESESAYDQLGISADKSKGFTEGLDIIAPADCKIISAEENTIEIEFDATEQPKISILDGYTMIIEGITLTEEISITDENGNTTVTTLENAVENGVLIKVGSVIGKTGTVEIKVTLQNDIGRILSNVEDYMAPDTRKMWDGNFSEEFLFHLAFIEGMPIIEDEYFTKANKGVVWGGEKLDKNYEENKYKFDEEGKIIEEIRTFEETVTVGPGLYLKYQADRFRNKGITIKEFESEKENFSYWRYNAQPYKIPKDVTVDVYIELLEEAKASIEKENLDLTQEQFEALLMLRWNVGGNADRYRDVIDIIKNGGDLASVWLKASDSDGLDNRRLLEYTLFTTGVRTVQEGNEIEFTSETPFTDMLEGKSSYTLK